MLIVGAVETEYSELIETHRKEQDEIRLTQAADQQLWQDFMIDLSKSQRPKASTGVGMLLDKAVGWLEGDHLQGVGGK